MQDQIEKPDIKESCYYDEAGNLVRCYSYYKNFKDIEFPIFTKGKQIKGQAYGNLAVPRYAGT